MAWRPVLTALAITSWVSACGGIDQPVACATYAIATISLSVEDSVTHAEFPFTNLRARAVSMFPVEGAFGDSIHVDVVDVPFFQGLGGWERPGIYSVTVTADGYLPWTSMVGVSQEVYDGCHIKGAIVRARLKRAPDGAQPGR